MTLLKNLLRCILMPFNTIKQIQIMQEEYIALYLLSKKHIPHVTLKDFLLQEVISLTDKDFEEYVNDIMSMDEEEEDNR